MLTTDLCLAYETNRELAKCRIDNDCNANNWNCKACKKLFRKGKLEGFGELDLDQGNCCAWSTAKYFQGLTKGKKFVLQGLVDSDFCGASATSDKMLSKNRVRKNRPQCCKHESDESFGDCDNSYNPQGPAVRAIQKFANDEKMWLRYYLLSWSIATTNGQQETLEYIT